MSNATANVKVKEALQGGAKAGWRAYRELVYGAQSPGYALRAELLFCLLGPMPGAAGLFLRGRLYRGLFGSAGRGLVIGRNVTFRHPRKIRLGERVVIDDNAVVDAKGLTNSGIAIEDGVFVGRNTIVYCKNGDITLKSGANLSSNCTIFSSNRLTIGRGTMVGAYTYMLSGGEYDPADPTPFADQSGMKTKGELIVGDNCWIGARVTVLDGASVGDRCVIGAGAVVTRPVPAGSLAMGVPARVVRSL